MAAFVNRQWVLNARPQGMIKDSDFAWREGEATAPEDGQILVRVQWLSFDPAQRTYLDERENYYVAPVAIGEVMRANGAGEVVESRAAGFKKGDWVRGMFGWQDYSTLAPNDGLVPVAKIADGISPEIALGLLGGTGLTAYFGMTRVANVQAGQTVVVSGAAGATGSVAGQIARIHGARAIGIAGGAEKCRWLAEVAKFDAAIDYRSEDVGARLRELAPDGVNVFFDNVGGPILEAVIDRLAQNAVIAQCGAISGYNEPAPGPRNLLNLTTTRSKLQGFLLLDYIPEFGPAIAQLTQWAKAGQLVGQVDVQHGLEQAPATLRRLFEGKNLGKQLLKF